MTSYHSEHLYKLCRVCGYSLSGAGKVSYSAKAGRELLNTVFGVDVSKDEVGVHPEKYCHKCRGVIYHYTKKKGIYKTNREVFQWSPHTGEDCTICKHIHIQCSAGRKPKKKKKLKGDHRLAVHGPSSPTAQKLHHSHYDHLPCLCSM